MRNGQQKGSLRSPAAAISHRLVLINPPTRRTSTLTHTINTVTTVIAKQTNDHQLQQGAHHHCRRTPSYYIVPLFFATDHHHTIPTHQQSTNNHHINHIRQQSHNERTIRQHQYQHQHQQHRQSCSYPDGGCRRNCLISVRLCHHSRSCPSSHSSQGAAASASNDPRRSSSAVQ